MLASRSAPAEFTIVSSMPVRLLATPEPQRLVATCAALKLPLLVVHDPPPDATTFVPPPGVTAVEIFEAAPYLRPLMRPGSIIDVFYNETNAAEPFERHMRYHGIASAKLLVRKVAAMAYALRRARRDTAVIWADADVELLRPPDAAFLRFVAARDVSYVPFVQKKQDRSAELRDARWRVDSGVMAFRAGDAAIGLVTSALGLYGGGMLRLSRRCRTPVTGAGRSILLRRIALQEEAAWGRDCPRWLTANLFLNDVYVWALLLHAAAANATGPLPPALASELGGFDASRLSQGWLAYNFSRQRVYAGRKKVHYPTFAAPGATAWTSPFDLRDYALHHIQTGPYSAVRNVQQRVHNRTAKMGRLESWLRIPGSGFVARPDAETVDFRPARRLQNSE